MHRERGELSQLTPTCHKPRPVEREQLGNVASVIEPRVLGAAVQRPHVNAEVSLHRNIRESDDRRRTRGTQTCLS